MRFFDVILTLAALAVALPSDKGGEAEVKAREPEPLPDKSAIEVKVYERDPAPVAEPVLDDKIAAHENERRTVNLSPRNNAHEGLLPRQCNPSSYCPCASGARGLWCGYCTSPMDAIYRCRSGSCLNDVFQCGSGGACCSYGRRTSCANRNGPCGG
ncbi:hypothetical protein DL771_003662 [Monosporascus sp. 5C6A]|nr:hypothetical protein DL771_003662 [Monosporascus sp. 5C6A]